MTEAANGVVVGNGGDPNGSAPVASAPTNSGGLDWNAVNWNEFDPSVLPRSVIEKHPDFNGLRSVMDKRHSATEQRYQRQLQELQQSSQQQMQQLQQILGNRLGADVQNDIKGWETQNQMEQLRRENQALRAYYGRQNMLSELSTKHGIPLDELADVEEPTQAYERIVSHQSNTLASLQKQLAELTAKINGQVASAAIPPMDQGAGAATTTAAQYQQQYDEAMKSRNTSAADRIQMEAIDKGINLDLYSFRKKV